VQLKIYASRARAFLPAGRTFPRAGAFPHEIVQRDDASSGRRALSARLMTERCPGFVHAFRVQREKRLRFRKLIVASVHERGRSE